MASSEKKIVQVFKKHQKFLVTMHVRPDPDALGAAIVMALYLKSIGKDVRLLNEDAAPSFLRFMPQTGLCRGFKGTEKFRPDVAVVLDCGDLARVGKVQGLITRDVRVVNIDHHVTNALFGHENLVLTKYSSTSEILYQLLKKAGCRFTQDMAILLYLGILTDTGSFGFDCTSSHTHQVIAELLKFDFSVADLYRQVYEVMPRHDLKPFLAGLNRMELSRGERVASLVLTQKDVARFSGDFDLRDKIFGFLRSVKGIEVIVIFTEVGRGEVRVNLRSRGAFNVARLAELFGGGGHKKASGCILKGSVGAVKRKIFAEIGKGLS